MRAWGVACALLGALSGADAARKVVAFPEASAHLACAICKEGVEYIHGYVEEKRAGRGRLREDTIQEWMEASCNPKTREGRWLRYWDIKVTDDGKGLDMLYAGEAGRLKRKTQTLADACSQVLLADSDLSGYLYKGKKDAKWLTKYHCVDGGEEDVGPCHKRAKKPKLGKKLKKLVEGEPFEMADNAELSAEEQMAEMAAGMPGVPEEALKMYRRDNMEEMAIDELMKEGADEEEAREMYREMMAAGMFGGKGGAPGEGGAGEGLDAFDDAEMREAYKGMQESGYFGKDDPYPFEKEKEDGGHGDGREGDL